MNERRGGLEGLVQPEFFAENDEAGVQRTPMSTTARPRNSLSFC
jgi:hypothetical protein